MRMVQIIEKTIANRVAEVKEIFSNWARNTPIVTPASEKWLSVSAINDNRLITTTDPKIGAIIPMIKPAIKPLRVMSIASIITKLNILITTFLEIVF